MLSSQPVPRPVPGLAFQRPGPLFGEEPDPVEVTIASIVLDAGTQVRKDGIRADTIVVYRDLLTEGKQPPPVKLRREPSGRLLAGDGFHRIEALRQEGRTTILAVVRPGGVEDAIADGLAGNRGHGLQMGTADRANAVRLLLQGTRYREGKLSQGQIAELVGVSQPRVSRLQAELTHNGLLVVPATRTGLDGRTTDTSQIGRGRAKKVAPASNLPAEAGAGEGQPSPAPPQRPVPPRRTPAQQAFTLGADHKARGRPGPMDGGARALLGALKLDKATPAEEQDRLWTIYLSAFEGRAQATARPADDLFTAEDIAAAQEFARELRRNHNEPAAALFEKLARFAAHELGREP